MYYFICILLTICTHFCIASANFTQCNSCDVMLLKAMNELRDDFMCSKAIKHVISWDHAVLNYTQPITWDYISTVIIINSEDCPNQHQLDYILHCTKKALQDSITNLSWLWKPEETLIRCVKDKLKYFEAHCLVTSQIMIDFNEVMIADRSKSILDGLGGIHTCVNDKQNICYLLEHVREITVKKINKFRDGLVQARNISIIPNIQWDYELEIMASKYHCWSSVEQKKLGLFLFARHVIYSSSAYFHNNWDKSIESTLRVAQSEINNLSAGARLISKYYWMYDPGVRAVGCSFHRGMPYLYGQLVCVYKKNEKQSDESRRSKLELYGGFMFILLIHINVVLAAIYLWLLCKISKIERPQEDLRFVPIITDELGVNDIEDVQQEPVYSIIPEYYCYK